MLPLSAISAGAAILFGVLWLTTSPESYYVTADRVRMRVKTACGMGALIFVGAFATFQFVIPYQAAATTAAVAEIVPVYPGSKLEMDSPAGESMRVLVFSAGDDGEAVLAYLRSAAAAQGWEAASGGGRALQFTNDDGEELMIMLDTGGTAATTIRYVLTGKDPD